MSKLGSLTDSSMSMISSMRHKSSQSPSMNNHKPMGGGESVPDQGVRRNLIAGQDSKW